MRLNTILVITNILSRSDTASFSSVIICYTTVKTLYMSTFSLLLVGAGTGWPGSCCVGFGRLGTLDLVAVSWCVFGSVQPRVAVAKDKFVFTNLVENTLPVVFFGVGAFHRNSHMLWTLRIDPQQYYFASLRCYATAGKHVAHLPLTCDVAGEMRPR
jgi:hypothetical protein